MIYCAIGDIHGMYNHLIELLDKIETVIDQKYSDDVTFVFLGDYVDRGPDSRKVVDLLLQRIDDNMNDIILPGNHEEMMSGISRYTDSGFKDFMLWWGSWGGFETLKSYFSKNHDCHDFENWKKSDFVNHWVEEWLRSFPDHYKFIDNCLNGVYTPNETAFHLDETDRIMFTHAGIHPDIPSFLHNEADFMWSRDAMFLKKGMKWTEASVDLVVHGHTIMNEEEGTDTHRIGLDRGAYSNGILASGIFKDGQQVDTITVTGPPAAYKKPI